MEKVVIIGSGPAGHTAAIYTARAGLSPLMYEGVIAGGPAGGQLTTTTEIENFPGFPEGVTGQELMERTRKQSEKFGVRILMEDVVKVHLDKYPFCIEGDTTITETQSIIIATGATARRLHVPGEKQLWNRGMSACAVCDGALPVFRNKELLVVGGGDTAVEEALYLTRFASKVYVAHRRDKLRASQVMAERLLAHPKIQMLWNKTLTDAEGQLKVENAVLTDTVTGEKSKLPVAGIFYAIGHTPNTAMVAGQLEMDSEGYIITRPGTTRTSVKGVFAAGDIQDRNYRQAIVAAGSGCMAAHDAQRFLEGLETD